MFQVVSSERDPETEERVATTFAVSDGGEYVDADTAVSVFSRMSEDQTSALLSHQVSVLVQMTMKRLLYI